MENNSYDKEILLDTLMLDAGSIGVNTTNPDQYYIQCKMWWRKWKPTFKAWFDTLDIDYHPEWNLDYHEASHDFTDQVGTNDTITKNKEIMDDDTTGSLTSKTTVDNDTTSSLTGREITDTDTTETGAKTEVIDDDATSTSSETKNVTGSSNTSTTHDVSAFDSEWVTDPVTGNLVPQYQPEWRENEHKTYTEATTDGITGSTTDDRTTTTNETKSGTVDTTVNKTESTTGTDDTQTDVTQSTAGTDDRTTTFDGNVDNDTTQKTDYTHDMFRNGNYGTTSTQDLLTQELKLRFFNTYEHIAQIFIKEMTCAVW